MRCLCIKGKCHPGCAYLSPIWIKNCSLSGFRSCMVWDTGGNKQLLPIVIPCAPANYPTDCTKLMLIAKLCESFLDLTLLVLAKDRSQLVDPYPLVDHLHPFAVSLKTWWVPKLDLRHSQNSNLSSTNYRKQMLKPKPSKNSDHVHLMPFSN